MNAERLLQHYEQIADAPDAIARLRRFILDLAVRGKLVPQDAADEPASELLKRIAAEKAQLGKVDKVRAQIDNEDELGQLPPTWCPVPLIDLGAWAIGSGFPKNEQGLDSGPHFFLKVSDMNLPGNEKFITTANNFIDDEAARRMRARVHPAGTIIFPKIGGAIATNKRRILTRGAAIDNNCLGIKFADEINVEWAFLLLTSLDFTRYQAGTAVPALQQGVLERIPVGLPPIAEQHRIVAKFDELMALCDELEAARTEREAKRDRLAAASLARLTPPDPETFRDDARFALHALPALTARPNQIKQLRQTILNLAVRGKLVPQDPADEPAEELLNRVLSRKGRSRKPLVEISTESAPYDLPGRWTWASLDQLVVFGPQNGISPRPTSRDEAPKAITLTATTSGTFNPAHFKLVEGTFPTGSDFWLSDGDLLFQRGNTPEYVGMAAIYTGPPHTFLFPDLIIKVRVSEDIDLSYVHLASISPCGRQYLTENASGAQATMPKINQTTLLSLPIPLPPLAEQHRIVAKVDELMALCDQLEASLTSAAETRKKLLDALLAEALAPVETVALQEAAE